MAFIPFPFAKMHWIKPLIKKNLFSPPVHPPPTNSSMFSATKIIIIVIILVVIIFLIYGLLHFLVRFLMNKMRLSLNSHHQSTRFQENGDVYQRQLQQLFNLHDGGLDQSSIDALPIFIYKELVGLNEPLHCAVCLCEFSQQDHLRLLPVCSHAFHIHCIDTWLLSNSTCPLCRGSLFTPGFSVINPVFDFEFDHSREELEDGHGVSSSGTTTIHTHDGVFGNFNKKCERVYPVRLGKFRAMNGENEEEVGESSSNGNLDERRCYSMGSYEYVVGNSELQVAFWSNGISRNEKEMVNSSIDEGRNGKEISNGSKGESFSVSKIWLWSKKHHHKFQDSSIPIWTNPLSM